MSQVCCRASCLLLLPLTCVSFGLLLPLVSLSLGVSCCFASHVLVCWWEASVARLDDTVVSSSPSYFLFQSVGRVFD